MSDNSIPEGERKIQILVSKTCPHCKTVEALLKDDIASGKIKLVYTDSDEGKSFMEKLGIKAVPTVIGVIMKTFDQIGYICKLSDSMAVEKCIEVEKER